MAVSTCAKCGSHTFERALLTPLGEPTKVAVLQCAKCGALIGTLNENLQNQIAAIDAGLVRISNALNE